MYYFCVILIVFARELESYEDNWDYSNLHCRDPDKFPVDWWYIYKPPSEIPILRGTNFTYILPDTHGRWQMSDIDESIATESMLQFTLEPLYRQNYKEHLAYLISVGKTEYGTLGGSSVYGSLLANEGGGIWIGHSIPGFPDLKKDHAEFPDKELPFGHFLMCLTLDLPTMNLLASLLKEARPHVQMHVPPSLRPKLPFWQYFNRGDMHRFMSLDRDTIALTTAGKKLPVTVMVRRPNDNSCLYTQFANKKQIIMDVYEHDANLKPFCGGGLGLRHITSISLKTPDHLFYIPSASDKMGFAVSTAAHWQQKGSSGPGQYWACVSTIENEERTAKGGIIVCVEDYNVWWSFDNLKVKEPKCYILVLFLFYFQVNFTLVFSYIMRKPE